jgi:hypothetical protein
VRKPRPRSDDEEDDQKHDSGHRRDPCKKRRDRGYETFGDTYIVAAGYSDRRDDWYYDQRNDRRDDRRDGNCISSGGNRGNYREHPPRVLELSFAEQLNAPCSIHAYIDPKDNAKKSSHLLRYRRQFLDL